MDKRSRVCVLLGSSLLALALSHPSLAVTPRATEEEMEAAAKPLDEYLRDIRANYDAVEGLVLKRGKTDLAQTIRRLEEHREATDDSFDKAVCDFLLARAFYWRAFHEFKTTHNKEAFGSSRPKVVSQYLKAFQELNLVNDAAVQQSAFRTRLVQTFAQALGTNIWGGSLTVEEKNSVVRQFVDVVEKSAGFDKQIPPEQMRAAMYRNLGMEERLEHMAPAELPKEYKQLVALLTDREQIMSPEMRLRIADVLEREHEAVLGKEPSTLAHLARIHQAAGDKRKALDLYNRAASIRPEYWLPAYMLSLDGQLGIAEAERDGYLKRFIGAGRGRLDARDAPAASYTREEAYDRAAEGLLHGAQFAECLRVVSAYEADREIRTRGGDAGVQMTYRRAACLDGLGQRLDAIREYSTFLECTEDGGRFAKLREIAQRRAAQLASTQQDAK